MRLIVGLGNPEPKYFETFHNVGFMCVDLLADKLGVAFDKKECKAITAHTFVNGEKVIIAKPQTYMNLSGESVLELVNKYKIPVDKIIVAYDDIDIDIGCLRIRANGSSGTHNGMRNIVALLKSTDFPRVRIGIGKQTDMPLVSFVLSKVSKDDIVPLKYALSHAVSALTEWAEGDSLELVGNKHNVKKAPTSVVL